MRSQDEFEDEDELDALDPYADDSIGRAGRKLCVKGLRKCFPRSVQKFLGIALKKKKRKGVPASKVHHEGSGAKAKAKKKRKNHEDNTAWPKDAWMKGILNPNHEMRKVCARATCARAHARMCVFVYS